MAITAELKGITKAFGNRTVLDSVNLQIHEGEILALLGPNGSGKTTLLKILAFIEDPTSGEVKFQGETVSFKNTEKMRLQSTLVFQKTTLFDTSVYNNIAYGLRIRKMPHDARNEEMKKALRLVKLDGFEKRPARKLSGGEQQRVAIARALANDPDVILADEPTGNLDTITGEKVMKFLNKLNDKGKTIIMVTHDSEVAKKHAKTIYSLRDGKIVGVEKKIGEKWKKLKIKGCIPSAK